MKSSIASLDLSNQIVGAIEGAIGPPPVALHEPSFKGNEWHYLKECLDSTFVSSVGKYVDKFENELASYTGARFAVAFVNGTAALHIGLLVAGVKRDDEVLVPALTFVATANAITYCGATPHFVDSEESSFGIDAVKLRSYLKEKTTQINGYCINKSTGCAIKAIIPMHVFGHPCNLDQIIAICNDFNIALVEDAAESLGSYYCGRHTGTFGVVGALSFNGNKVITTGGGGALLTNNEEVAKLVKHLSTTAKKSHPWEYDHDLIAYNYRMPNINAALGCAQLEELPNFLRAKRTLAKVYEHAFSCIDGVSFKTEQENCISNYWLQTIVLDTNHEDARDSILIKLNNYGYTTRPVWKLLSSLRHFKQCPAMDLSCALSLEKRILNIPSSSHLARFSNE